jgi:uncharacterized glyoxalase superfamily protein PhnB
MEHRSGIVPYLFYSDAEGMIGWYATVFGFTEHSRYTDESGRITNAEMVVGDTELWIDGNPPAGWSPDSIPWIGVGVASPDEVYERIRAHGVHIDPPVNKPYRVRMTGSVRDPAGYSWAFMRRILG